MPGADRFEAWLDALVARHTRTLSTPEFLKAVRALSARYVERRAELPDRSPIDSAGKRAAFAAFFAPLHFLTTREVLRSLGADGHPIQYLVDLGCGTGAASAAWALLTPHAPAITGIDRHGWVLDEAAWNWRTLGLGGRTRRADLVRVAEDVRRKDRRRAADTAILLAWSVNELNDADRAALLPTLVGLARSGSPVLVIEPLARTAVPWWDVWADGWRDAGGRADEWKLHVELPAALATLNEAAGFRRPSLGARSLWLPGRA